MTRLGWFDPSSWIVLETGAEEIVAIKQLEIEAERRVGKAKLTFLRLAS